MPNVIQHKRNSTAGTVPSTGSLSQGELGINIGDGKLYTKNSSNTIINLGVTSVSGTSITPATGLFSGRVGIGTTSPSGVLHVVGSGLVSSVTGTVPNHLFHIYSATTGANIFNVEGTNGSLFSVVDNLSGSLMSVNNNAGLPIFEVFSDDRVVAGRFGQNDFIMTSGGNVGIGTGVPSSKFHVLGSSNFNGDITVTGSVIVGSGSAANPSIEFINDTDTGMFSAAENTIAFATSGSERIRIANNGNIGINTTNPTSTLHVTGSGLFSNNITASGFIRSGGTSSQFLKADGSVDSSSYYLSSNPNGYTSNVGTVTSVAALTIASTGTDLTSSVANGTTTPVITLSVPTASASNRGVLSSSDWTTFNNKQNALTNPVTGSSTSGYVSFWNGSTTQGGDANLFWNNTDKRLGIGTSSPSGQLHIIGTGIVSTELDVGNISITNNSITTTTGNLDISPIGGTLSVGGLSVILEGDARLNNARNPTFHTHYSNQITPVPYLNGDFSILDGIIDSVSTSSGDWSSAREDIIGAAALSHSHGNINSSGQIGSTSDLLLVTSTSGTITTSSNLIFNESSLRHSAGNFAAAEDAQAIRYVVRRLTTDATANQVLFLNGSSTRFTIPAKTTCTFTVKLSAYNDTDNACAGWIFRGVIRRNNANSTALVGSVIEENWEETAMVACSASVVADDTNEALEIRVTGIAGKNIRWVAVVDMSKVSY